MSLFWFWFGLAAVFVAVIILSLCASARKTEDDEAIAKAFEEVNERIGVWRDRFLYEADELAKEAREQSVRDYRVNQAYVDASLRVHEQEFHAPKSVKKGKK
jgi:hypothetical protein